MQEPWAQSPHWKDALEDDMANYSGIPSWRNTQTEKPAGL